GSPNPPVCTSRTGALIVGLAELPESNRPSVTFFAGTGGLGKTGAGVFSATTLGGSGAGIGFMTGASILGSSFGWGGGSFGSSRSCASTLGGGGGTGLTITGFSSVGAIQVTLSCVGVTSFPVSRGIQAAIRIMKSSAAKLIRLLAPQRFHCLGALTSVKVGMAEALFLGFGWGIS